MHVPFTEAIFRSIGILQLWLVLGQTLSELRLLLLMTVEFGGTITLYWPGSLFTVVVIVPLVVVSRLGVSPVSMRLSCARELCDPFIKFLHVLYSAFKECKAFLAGY